MSERLTIEKIREMKPRLKTPVVIVPNSVLPNDFYKKVMVVGVHNGQMAVILNGITEIFKVSDAILENYDFRLEEKNKKEQI